VADRQSQRNEREALAAKRLLVNLRTHVIATSRTLEQKISDAGPYNQRIDPHVLTPARNRLVGEGRILTHEAVGTTWFYLPGIGQEVLHPRFYAQAEIYEAINAGSLPKRIGQALEIATFKALAAGSLDEFMGRYTDLEAHDDSTLYRKEEPPQHIGKRTIPGAKRLDFLIRHPSAGYLGVECKNTRPWLYPHDSELKDTLHKCLALNAVPVIIGRRLSYVAFAVLSPCGVIFHQCFNQLFPRSAADLAAHAKDKDLLGYHDIRVGNEPDQRLLKFIVEDLPKIADETRQKFEAYSDLLDAYANQGMPYEEFAGRAARRQRGENEDFDENEYPPF
jgi:hypothetical protein